MIKTRIVSRGNVFEQWSNIIGEIDNINEGVVRRTAKKTAPDALRSLRHTPGKPKYPIAWTSERQRRAFFASNGFERGIPTKRSGKLQDGWSIVATRRRRSTVIVIENSTSYARYVQGEINFKSPAEALAMRQRFHKDTGWRAAQPIIADFYRRYRDAYKEEFRATWGDAFAKPFTRRRYD